ncbi:hypothetical protein [Pacificibacter marinus]|jgi:hypothetical protein|uniref:Uncharacterized protein n=1 Tax=Pacificibacter marinus TaxID=658057 RepID=A0A1Y5RB98_9RHOB|nr:hypothetical protein [Pacificibacter marinus]SEK25011.1 hypothetical protein SAMN04488032_101468 [Pacificibacter marinus]SLN13366.1 hypothetical protein PAM7971_00179 [Pacificibacter marinus]
MKKTVLILAVSIAFSGPMMAPSTASAGVIERACNASDRKASSRALCGCIQQAADLTLKNSDQRKAAKFFKDPHKAQELRQADGRANETFWLRYKNFGTTAAQHCAS